MGLSSLIVRRRLARGLLALSLLAVNLPLLAGGPPGRPPTPVRVAEAVQVKLAPQQWLAATVVSRRDAGIAAEASGRLLSVAEVGTQVKKGDVLARFDDTFARLKVEELTAGVAREKATLAFLRGEMRRLTRLAKQNNTAQTQLDEVESRQLAARSELNMAQTRLARAQEELRRQQIVAPFAGVVVARDKVAGEWASSGDVLLRLVDATMLEAQAAAPLLTRDFVRPGDRLQLQVDGRMAEGAVRVLVPAADARSHQLDLRVSLSGDGWAVGQPLRVAIPVAADREVLAVPRDALVLRSQGAAVFRINGEDKAERIAVTPGVASGALIAVSGNLQAGDRVVTRGGERLRPGQAVRVLSDEQ